MLYGIVALISGFLGILSMIKTGKGLEQASSIIFRMWGAVMTVVVPCETGQMLLDQVEQIRESLLELPPTDLATGQELGLFVEATRRDAERLGDISFYRLRRSTVLAITSAVITYIIVFMQFQMTEFETPCLPKTPWNETAVEQ
ncbi:hypothetical protein FJT64_000620 [Amphibalanus amphitrite]|uniref:Gustatory receptor n=1 Tax=Amphibalanus amphitrite TaxID=1232801 RepID=A0A6A4VUT3_AMPAM|nr:hypothetical protein FJT64_000620 [Amphibalanus amphitrite]